MPVSQLPGRAKPTPGLRPAAKFPAPQLAPPLHADPTHGPALLRAASPQQLLQLQRQLGNRAVQGIIGQSQAAPSGAQRVLVHNFVGDAGVVPITEREKKFQKLVDAYVEYAQLVSSPDRMGRILKLIAIQARAEGYYTKYGKESSNKLRDAQDLWLKAQAELITERGLASAEFKQYRSEVKNDPDAKKRVGPWTTSVRAKNAEFKQFISGGLPPELADLTPAERKAIRIYTDEAYKIINPALSGDKGWIGDLNEARQQFGKKVGTMANVGLQNMPATPWKPGDRVYRGLGVSLEEGKALGHKLKAKTFPYLLSTSEDKARAKSFSETGAGGSRGARPVALTYTISKWKSARNIAKLSVNPGERELLFPINSTFDVVGILSENFSDKTKPTKEVEIQER